MLKPLVLWSLFGPDTPNAKLLTHIYRIYVIHTNANTLAQNTPLCMPETYIFLYKVNIRVGIYRQHETKYLWLINFETRTISNIDNATRTYKARNGIQ
jgi:hypothetical protein